jgi:hypothetical protein
MSQCSTSLALSEQIVKGIRFTADLALLRGEYEIDLGHHFVNFGVVKRIRAFLEAPLDALRGGKAFEASWSMGIWQPSKD